MATIMTKDWLAKHCRERGLYQTPYLNDRLYLQCQAFCDIQNLEEYTGVKLLYLEENCLETMNGLQPLRQLQCLYLRKNFIKSIDHLEELEYLDTLDISQNYITCLENLSKCLNLRVLVVSHNQLESIESIAHLTSCPSIVILDLSHNELKDGDGVVEITNIIANLTKLSHLDDRPVFWDERLYAEAWFKGGQEAESAERDRVREIRAEEETKQFESMRQIREQNMAERLHVRRPNLLQFDPSELGEVEPGTCGPHDNSGVLSEDEVGVTPVCAHDIVCVPSPEELAPPFQQVVNFPEDWESSPSTDIVSEVQHDCSKHDLGQKLNSNPLFNDNASVSVRQVQRVRTPGNSSMFSNEVQSICLPEWVGSESRPDSYSFVHDNKLFSETALEEDSSSDGPTSQRCLPIIDGLHREELGSSTLKGCGRDSLAALAVSELETYTCQNPCSLVKEEDNFIVSLQTMNDVKVDSCHCRLSSNVK